MIFNENNQFCFDFGSKGKENSQFRYNSPQNLTIDRFDEIIISDPGNDRIQIFESDGSFLSSLQIDYPNGISSDSTTDKIAIIDGISKSIKLISIPFN